LFIFQEMPRRQQPPPPRQPIRDQDWIIERIIELGTAQNEQRAHILETDEELEAMGDTLD
jgi:hypothetical protein